MTTEPISDPGERCPLPTFIVIGAQKSATRWLRINLGQHPDIFTNGAEMHFWNNGNRVKNLGTDWYRDQFEGWKGEPIVGEATPGYMIWRHHPDRVAERMRIHHPDAKLIAILRNPIDRAQSAMKHHIRRERIPSDARLVDVVRERRPVETDWFCLVTGGWYAACLGPFIEQYGDQVLVLFQDEVVDDPVRPFRRALEHVGARTDFVPDDIERVVFSNQGGRAGRKNQLTAEDRVELWPYFRDDVAHLELMLGTDLSRWVPEGVESP